MVDEDGNAKILDFGIARTVRSKGITGPGVLIGTPQYMSPEQVDGGEVDPRADLYSLGVILYEMATGQVPFDGDTPLSVAHKQKYDAPADPRTLNAQLPPDLGALILKCLAKDRTARYQSASDVGADLDKIEQGLPTTERALARKHTASTQITIPFGPRWLLAGVAALVLVVVAVFLWRPWTPRAPLSPKTGKPRIAVTWFDNQSDRPDLDRALAGLLTTNLSREGAIDVVSTQKLFDILRQLGKVDAKTIDRSLATDVATRAGAGTMVTGSIVKLGDQVRITAELVDVASGRIVATIQEDGKRIDDVFPMVDRLTQQIRSKLGLAKTSPADALKVADVSTQSLEAFERYQKGIEFNLRWNWTAAAKELEQAVAVDPSFAMAWVELASARLPSGSNWVFGDYGPGRQALAEAKKYIGKVNERERLHIELMDASLPYDEARRSQIADALVAKYPDDRAGNYALAAIRESNGDLPGARVVYERFLELNPADANSYNNLAYVQSALGDHQAAVSTIKKYVALHPDVSNSADSAWEIHVRAGLYDEALAYADRYRQMRPTLWSPWRLRVQTFLLEDDAEQARKEAFAPKDLTPSARVSQAHDVGYTYLVEGRFREAEEAFRKTIGLAEALPADAGPAAAQRAAHFNVGRMLMVEGRTADAIREFQAGEESSARGTEGRPDPYAAMSRYLIGSTLAQTGDHAGALRKADEIRDLVRKNGFNPPILDLAEFLVAQVEEARRNPKAMDSPLGRVGKEHRFNSPIYRGLMARRAVLEGDVAAAFKIYERWRFDELMSAWDSGQTFTYFYERSRLGFTLGRLYEQQRDVAKAREQYSRFLRLMARADPGLPDVEDAKKRLAALGPE
jgi:tetratricopeptide (TPR) repeat protein